MGNFFLNQKGCLLLLQKYLTATYVEDLDDSLAELEQAYFSEQRLINYITKLFSSGVGDLGWGAENRLVYLRDVAVITTNYDNLVDLELQWSL